MVSLIRYPSNPPANGGVQNSPTTLVSQDVNKSKDDKKDNKTVTSKDGAIEIK